MLSAEDVMQLIQSLIWLLAGVGVLHSILRLTRSAKHHYVVKRDCHAKNSDYSKSSVHSQIVIVSQCAHWRGNLEGVQRRILRRQGAHRTTATGRLWCSTQKREVIS